MKKLGQILFWIGIIIGMIAGAKNPQAGDNFSDIIPAFVVACVVSLIGAILWRKALDSETTDVAVDDAHITLDDARAFLGQARQKLGELDLGLSGTNLCDGIDLILEPIDRVVSGRNSLMRSMDSAAYAILLSELAGAERKLNRIWSMAADGYHNKEEFSIIGDDAGTFLKNASENLS